MGIWFLAHNSAIFVQKYWFWACFGPKLDKIWACNFVVLLQPAGVAIIEPPSLRYQAEFSQASGLCYRDQSVSDCMD